MSERYTKRFTLPQQIAREDLHAPVVVVAGGLLFDNQSGSALAQVKYQNISAKSIKSITVNISAWDSGGTSISGVSAFTYTGLVAAPGAFFGDKVPVIMTDNNAHAFAVDIIAVVFSDGTTWNKHSQEAANFAKEMGAQAASAAKEMGAQAATAAKKAPVLLLRLPALLVNIVFSIIMVLVEISYITDFAASPSVKTGVDAVTMGMATVVGLPAFHKILFPKKKRIVQRLLRWGVFAAIIAVNILLVEFVL